MAADDPIDVSPSVGRFLKSLRSLPRMEMGLMLAYGFESSDPNGQSTDKYDGVHFYVGWNERGKWSGKQVSLAGVDLWISEDIAEILQGKTLTILRRDNTGKQNGIEDLLVAV